MALRFTVLASGSGGNASFLQTDRLGLLLDIGLGPRELAARLTAAELSWRQVEAVLLTHTHSDHWNDRTLAHLRRLRIPLYCHADHHHALQTYGCEFVNLLAAGLVRGYEADQESELAPGLHCRALPLRHDGGATFGFRLEQTIGLFGQRAALGYAADLGSWSSALAQALTDVDILALEFNHDVPMQYASGRSPALIRRVLGDAGHLSNEQAAALVQEVLRRSESGRLQHVVQLHLSRDCNRADLARQATATALSATTVSVHTARQDRPLATLHIGLGGTAKATAGRRRVRTPAPQEFRQEYLPGFEV